MRAPVRRLLELLVLVAVTGTLWFLASYASSCKALPRPVGFRAPGSGN